MSVRLRRAYEAPGADDGVRILVDRVWPRGRTREALRLDGWMKEIGPSTELRTWFGHDPDRWEEFRSRYRQELSRRERASLLDELTALARAGRLTIVFGARDAEHSQARVIADEIGERLGEP